MELVYASYLLAAPPSGFFFPSAVIFFTYSGRFTASNVSALLQLVLEPSICTYNLLQRKYGTRIDR